MARSLEAAWEDKLAAVTRAETALATEQARQPSPLSAEEIDWLTRAGADIRAIFEAPATTPRERKQLIRALLTEVILTVDRQARTAALTLCREGGAITQRTVALPRLGAPWRTTQASTVDLIRRLAAYYDDATIAGVLARQHRRTGTGLTFTKARVAEVRRNYRIPPFRKTAAAACHDGHVVSITQAAACAWLTSGIRWLRFPQVSLRAPFPPPRGIHPAQAGRPPRLPWPAQRPVRGPDHAAGGSPAPTTRSLPDRPPGLQPDRCPAPGSSPDDHQGT